MIKKILGYSICMFLFLFVQAQNDSVPLVDTTVKKIQLNYRVARDMGRSEPVYKIKNAVDIPITAVGMAWSLYALTKIYNKDPSGIDKIMSLKPSDVNGFDRWSIRPYSENADKISYYPFYAAMPLPLLLLLGEKTRKDFFKLSFL